MPHHLLASALPDPTPDAGFAAAQARSHVPTPGPTPPGVPVPPSPPGGPVPTPPPVEDPGNPGQTPPVEDPPELPTPITV